MPTINNLVLEIGRPDDVRVHNVTVRYQVCFTACEALAGSVFRERVVLIGPDDLNPDDHLITLRNNCLRARAGCVDRTLSARVPANTLDEDDVPLNRGDEIRADVSLRPFVPSAASVKSAEVHGQFG